MCFPYCETSRHLVALGLVLLAQTVFAQSTEGGTTKPEAKPAASARVSNTVTNVFVDTDIRQVLSEVGVSVGKTVVADSSIISQNISIEFKNTPLEEALDRLALFGGFFWKKKGDTYLVTNGLPEAPLFREFAVTRRFTPENMAVESRAGLVPLIYKPYILVDRNSNIVSITAPEALMPRIVADLRSIDAPSRQIVVEAIVTEVAVTDSEDLGFSFDWQNFSLDSNLGVTYSNARFEDLVRLKALISNNRAKLRASPRITAFEGREALLNVGQETYYSILTGNTAYPTAQVQLIKTGVTLKFTGFVAEDGTITLKLDPEVSDAVVSVNGNPTTNVRRASTSVRVRPGDTIAIGGLTQDASGESTSRVPVLSQIPVIGGIFKQRSSSKRRVETIIMITPRLSDDGVGTARTDALRCTLAPEGEKSPLVSLNDATLKDLERLPGIGETKAKAILEYRVSRKGFKSVDELRNVKGIGAGTFAKIKDLVHI